MKIPDIPIPILLVGAPGTGKTAKVCQAFDYVEVCLASTMVEEDIGGLRYRDGDYDYSTIPAMFRRLQEHAYAGKSTCLFLDELDKARRSVADTLLTLIASRQVGAAKLPPSTRIIAAANPPELGGSDGISDTMISRFCVIDYIPDPLEWADWADGFFASFAAQRVVEAVRQGELPILDIAGEGLNRRITAPRTLADALEIIEIGASHDLIRGLLTAATASQVMHLIHQVSNPVLQKSIRLRRGKVKLDTPMQPLRI